MTTPDVHEIKRQGFGGHPRAVGHSPVTGPVHASIEDARADFEEFAQGVSARFDPLRNESIERTCAIHEARLAEWRAGTVRSIPTVCPKR